MNRKSFFAACLWLPVQLGACGDGAAPPDAQSQTTDSFSSCLHDAAAECDRGESPDAPCEQGGNIPAPPPCIKNYAAVSSGECEQREKVEDWAKDEKIDISKDSFDEEVARRGCSPDPADCEPNVQDSVELRAIKAASVVWVSTRRPAGGREQGSCWRKVCCESG